jgi:murein L,D-transpeptidase YafK
LGELLMFEGNFILSRNDFHKAFEKFRLAEALIGQSGKEVAEMLDVYLKNIPVWRKWAEETINRSKENQSVAIIVDKIDHTCYIYDKGQIVQKYPIELGKNWIGHKRQKGDDATPEGQYSIEKKIGSGQSKYYKALVINYPNERDKLKFNEAKKRGELPKNAQIGGLIEIHGDGGKGINWTQGCIALNNQDMDKIFNKVAVGTSVTIVGSLNGMTSIKNNKLQNHNQTGQ